MVEEEPVGMGVKPVGVYHAVVMASWLCGALGKIHVRWGSLDADWNWCAMSVHVVSNLLAYYLTLFEIQQHLIEKVVHTDETLGIISVPV